MEGLSGSPLSGGDATGGTQFGEGLREEEEDDDVLLRHRPRKGASTRSRFTLSAGSSSEDGTGTLESVARDSFRAHRKGSQVSRNNNNNNKPGNKASKMLRKKMPESGLLMVPKRLWMHTVPTQDCDILALFSGHCGEATVNWVVSSIRTRVPELVVNVKSHMASGCFALYITATMDGLVRGGEELKLSKITKSEYGGGLRELSQAEIAIFKGVEDAATFFTSQERQSIVLHLVESLRASEGDEIGGAKFRPGQAIVPKLQTDGVITQILPLHDHEKLDRLRVTWVQSFFRYQPLDEIQEYFGPKIGIYFSWLGFYTASLTVPAVIGLVFWIYFWGKDEAKEDKAFVVLAFLNVVWGSMWLEAWKRRSAELTHRWGIHDLHHELLQDPRPLFQGDLEVSPVTGRLEPVYPSWKRNLFRYLVTIPVVAFCLSLVFAVMFLILQIQAWWDSVIEYRGLPSLLSYGPKFIMAGTISVFDEGYSKVAAWLNDRENYRSDETYHNHLIIKLAAFRLVNSFLVLFYIAFYLQDVEALKAQLAALFLTRQIVGNIKESCIPYFLEQLKLAKLSFELFGAISPSEAPDKTPPLASTNVTTTTQHESRRTFTDNNTTKKHPIPKLPSKSRIVSQAEVESNMSKYDDTFEDYLEMFIQFGYVMLFSSAFPLAAACAFVNNLVEIRSDAFKLCCVFQRPFAQRARSIGVWQDAMEFMCLLGIMVNCMLIGLSGQVHRMFPDMSTTQTILLIVVLEHAMIGLKYGISYAIPDVPQKIVEAMARAEFHRREAFKRISVSNSPPTRDESGQSSPRWPHHHLTSNVSSSMEYIERSVQTDVVVSTTAAAAAGSRKSSSSSDAKSQKDPLFFQLKRKESADSKVSSTEAVDSSSSSSVVVVNVGRSVSAGGDRAKQFIPKSSKRWNQSCLDNSQLPPDYEYGGGTGPTPSESLPLLLSAPANFDSKNPFSFAATPGEKPSPVRGGGVFTPERTSSGSLRSKSSESVAATNTIQEESVASDTPTEEAAAETVVEELPEEEEEEEKKKRPSYSSSSSRSPAKEKKSFPSSAESLPPVATPAPEQLPPGGESKPETPKVGKKHPVKFLKRAQSFSQVFKKMSDKRKKSGETLRDDLRFAIREPLGELALVPLEKLVSIEDLQNQMISEEP